MEKITVGKASSNFTPHKGGIDNDGGSPYPCLSSLQDSQENTHATDMSGTEEMPSSPKMISREELKFKWYIVLFSKPNQELKFRNFVNEHKDYSKNILNVYCPTHTVVKEYYALLRRERPDNVKFDKEGNFLYKERPLFAGSDFVYSTYQDLSVFLKTYYPCGSIQFKKRISTNQKSEPLTVTDKAMEDFRNFNENFADKAILLPKLFKEYAFNNKGDKPNEVLKIVDGPMAGLTGYLIKINRNKGLAFRVDNPYGGNPFTFGIPNIWDFHVTRLHNSSQDNQTLATEKPRAVDLLIGLLQKSGFPDDNILKELYSLVKKLSDEPSLENAAKSLLSETTASLNDHAKALTENLKDISDDDRELIFNLSRYEQEDPGYVKRNWSKLIIRPFLTPTSGIEIPEGKDYALLNHHSFTEIIKRQPIKEKVFNPATNETTTETSIYYAHVGLRKLPRKGYTLFTNWDEFLGKYFATDGEARKRLANVTSKAISITREKDGKEENIEKTEFGVFADFATTLFKVLTNQTKPIVAIQDMPVDKDTHINVLAYSLKGMTFEKNEKIGDNAEVQKAMQSLIDTGIQICKEISSSSHLAIWRERICTVWLHK